MPHLQGADTAQGTPVDLVVMGVHPVMAEGLASVEPFFLVDFINEMNLMWSLQLPHTLLHLPYLSLNLERKNIFFSPPLYGSIFKVCEEYESIFLGLE